MILGVDPGSRKTGFGIIKTGAQAGSKIEYVTSGIVRLPSGVLPARLKIIFDSISQLIQQYQPEEMAVEEVFLARDPSAALKLGQARGVAIVAGAAAGLAIGEYAARTVKKSVVGSGAASKEQVQHMVKHILGLPSAPAEDAEMMAEAEPTNTIVDVAAGDETFSTLVAAVNAADLGATLSGTGPYTVFAPTNDAFGKLPEGTVENLLKPENKDQLTAILTYHVVAGKVMSTDLSNGMMATTVQGTDVKIMTEGGVTVGGANVTAADIEASNGVIHVIDAVIMPKM